VNWRKYRSRWKLALAFATPLLAQPPQTLQDEDAVYDLLTPDSASFRMVHEVAGDDAVAGRAGGGRTGGMGRMGRTADLRSNQLV